MIKKINGKTSRQKYDNKVLRATVGCSSGWGLSISDTPVSAAGATNESTLFLKEDSLLFVFRRIAHFHDKASVNIVPMIVILVDPLSGGIEAADQLQTSDIGGGI